MNADHEPDDIVEAGPERSRIPEWLPFRGRLSRGASVLGGVALIVGAVAGYAVGHSQGHGSAASRPRVTVTATPSPSLSVGFFLESDTLIQDTPSCSTQRGHELQVGIQVTNQSTGPVVLQAAHAVLPERGALKEVSSEWAPCGVIPATVSPSDNVILPAGDSAWLSVTLKVQVRCPGAYPVQFSVRYLVRGVPVTAALPGFPDLGEVPYAGCPLSRAGPDSAASSPGCPGSGRLRPCLISSPATVRLSLPGSPSTTASRSRSPAARGATSPTARATVTWTSSAAS